MTNKSDTQKKVFLATFGCQMNVRDSEALLGLFLDKGYKSVDNPKDADVILLNTCAVRAHAEHRVRSILGALKKVIGNTSHVTGNTSKNVIHDTCYVQQKIIGLIGCMAKSSGRDVFEKMPHISLICSPAKLDKIPAHVEKIKKEGIRIIDLEDKKRDEKFYNASYRIKPDHAQVVISTGCSNYCSYCVVPYVRGKLRLRAPKDIIEEVKHNVALGRKKITLLGQNVNDYLYRSTSPCGEASHSDVTGNTSFVDLLKMVDEIDGVEAIDFLTPHPKNTSKELFKLMAKSKKIIKYIHLPYQSGSDKILKLMHRGYTRTEYLDLIEDYKTIVGGAIGTDIIVGFPTETDKDFKQTKEVLEKVRFMGAYIFKYSTRPGTAAAKLKDDVGQKVKEKRHNILLELQREISRGKK